jgi:hypothetical protein
MARRKWFNSPSSPPAIPLSRPAAAGVPDGSLVLFQDDPDGVKQAGDVAKQGQ